MNWHIKPNWRPDDGGGEAAVVEPGDGAAPPEGAAEPTAQPGQTPWYMHRINALTAKAKSADEQRAAAEAELQRIRALPAGGTGPSEEEIEQRVLTRAEKLAIEKAEKIADQKIFSSRLGEMGSAGRSEFGATEFNLALSTFQSSFGDLPNAFLEACLESGAGHKVIYELSKDLDRAASIMTLPSATKMTAEVVKLAAEIGGGKKKPSTPPAGGRTTSAAPPPIEPKVGGGSTAVGDLTKPQSTRDWIAQREAQLKAARR